MKNSMSVSIIIPVLNEAKYIANCLTAVCNQSYEDGPIEIIVVDNGSTDDTIEIASKFDVKIVQKIGCKIGGIRNFGVFNSEGSVLAFIDGDCVAGHDWVKSSVLALRKRSIGAVGGGFLLRDNPTWIEKYWCPNAIYEDREVKSLATGSFIMRRDLFQDLGGFDEIINAGEDTKLSYRIGQKGFALLLIKECFVVHLGYPQNITDFVKRQFWHSSSYIESSVGLDDKMFISVLLFTLSLFSFLLFSLTAMNIFAIGAIFIFLSPLIFAIKKYSDLSDSYHSPVVFFKCFAVCFLYYFGRSSGLSYSLYKFFRRGQVFDR